MPKLKFQYVRQENIETLLEFLVRRFRYHTLEQWESRIADGLVLVNGKTARPNLVLETRHKIVYLRPPGPEPEIDPRFTVLYEDEAVLAVSKSANIPTSPSGKYWDNCLVHLLQRELNLPGLHAVHRLDRETSGVNLFAKTKQAARQLGEDFRDGKVDKRYAAILRGHLQATDSYISAPLRGQAGGIVRIRQEVHPEGRVARTHFRLKAVLPGASLIEARPLTGRTHQIRAHAEYLGHPVWGDKLYGRTDAEFVQWVSAPERGHGRQLLHASALHLRHPTTGLALAVRDVEHDLVLRYLVELQAE